MRFVTPSFSIALAGAAAALSLAPPAAAADVEFPRAVPAAKLTQQVGLTEIGVEYECPAAAGRKIWGGIVPYDKVWPIAATPPAKIKFSRDVTLGDRIVAAGTYWMLAIPTKTAWTLVFNKSVEPITNVAEYKPELDVARVKVTPRPIPRRERLMFAFSDISDERATLELEWDALRVPIPIAVNTNQQVLSAITSLDGTWRSFANAARYMLETKKDYDAGLKYVDEALALKEDWYAMWVKGALYAAKGDFATASAWAEKAHELARKAGNGAPLEPDLTKAIVEWSKKGHRVAHLEPLDKETRPTAKVGVVGTPEDAQPETATSPPVFKPAAAQEPAKPPTEDPPPSLRRARLRHR